MNYVLITPVRNEEATIAITIDSVIRQTIRPTEWIIVSDQSTDRTNDIIKSYALHHPFIRYLLIEKCSGRGFGSVVFATETGIHALKTEAYDYIGFLDGDIKFQERYYEEILLRFSTDHQLGIAGGLVIDLDHSNQKPNRQSLSEVAGAVQFFSRECFLSLGGLVALPEGGWDAITCFQARMNGFKTRTFPELKVDHLKPRNIAEGNLFRRTLQLGVREYALGNHPLFEIVKCAYRSLNSPFFLDGILRFLGYARCYLNRKKRVISPEIIQFIRQEQITRLARIFLPGFIKNRNDTSGV